MKDKAKDHKMGGARSSLEMGHAWGAAGEDHYRVRRKVACSHTGCRSQTYSGEREQHIYSGTPLWCTWTPGEMSCRSVLATGVN